MRRHRFLISLIIFLLLGGGILCAIRWKAWFGNPAEPEWTADTINYHFQTFVADTLPRFVRTDAGWQDTQSPDNLRIILLGDVHNSLSHADFDTLAARCPDIDCYAQLGDFVERGYFYYYQQLFHELSGSAFDSLPILSCPGNHEYKKGIHRTLRPSWYEIFPQPANGPKDFIGSTYYVDFPHLRFIAIDTYGLQVLHHFTRVNAWVNQAIRGAEGRFVVVMMHQPVFSCGAGRQDLLIYSTFREPLRRADLVFAGHDHNYSRRLPFVNTNTATKYYLNKLNPRDERICSGHRLYEVLDIVKDTLTMQTYLLESGALYDQVRIIGHGKDRIVKSDFVTTPELIDLPERYAGKNTLHVRRFLNRRAARLKAGTDTTAQTTDTIADEANPVL